MPDLTPLDIAIVAVPETAGSALYGMVDVLSVTGSVWQTLTRTEPHTRRHSVCAWSASIVQRF